MDTCPLSGLSPARYRCQSIGIIVEGARLAIDKRAIPTHNTCYVVTRVFELYMGFSTVGSRRTEYGCDLYAFFCIPRVILEMMKPKTAVQDSSSFLSILETRTFSKAYFRAVPMCGKKSSCTPY